MTSHDMPETPKKKSPKPVAKVAKRGATAEPSDGAPRGSHAALLQGALAGDADTRAGFSFSPAWDRWFALGYPHVAMLVPDVVDDAKLDDVAVSVFNMNPYFVEWPEALARPLVRLLPRWQESFVPGTHELSDFAKKTLRDASDLGEGEAKDLLGRVFGAGWIVDRTAKTTMFLLEALIGERAASALVEVLVALPADKLTNHSVELSNAIARLGLMLRRTTASTRAALVEELERLFQRVSPKPPAAATDDRSLPVHALDSVLHGLEGARRAFPRGIGIGQLPFLDVPRELALQAIRDTEKVGPLATPPDVRRIFLAGAEALDVEAKWVAAYTKVVTTAPQIMLETYGRVNDRRTVGLVLELAKKKPLAKATDAWLLAHAALAKPELERIAASDPERAVAANAAMAKLR
jgi:hypothetical protein